MRKKMTDEEKKERANEEWKTVYRLIGGELTRDIDEVKLVPRWWSKDHSGSDYEEVHERAVLLDEECHHDSDEFIHSTDGVLFAIIHVYRARILGAFAQGQLPSNKDMENYVRATQARWTASYMDLIDNRLERIAEALENK